ncbi:MAG: hypothetical protein ACK5LJ_07070 [Paracoccus sp. (in: a-proteobacteria)]
MAFQLIADADVIQDGTSLLEYAPLNCFDTLGDDGFDEDRAGMLAQRSAFELVRDQLSNDQRAELDQVDAFWRENAEAFNADFALDQAYLDRKTVLAGLIREGKRDVPEVPAAHWWWSPLDVGAE